MNKKRYRKSVFFPTYKIEDGKIKYLLLKRKKHWKGWEFSKGGIERGETPKQAVLRELKEETGQKPINVINHKKIGKFRYQKMLDCRPGIIGQEYRLYSVEIKKDNVKIDKKEHYSFKWVNYKKALEILTWPNQRACLRIVNNFLIK